MEAKKLFNDELFCNLRAKAEQQELEQLYLESGCNEDVYYLIISHMLLKKYNCREQISLIKKFILHLFAALFCIIAVIFLVFGIKGYSMYRDAVTAYPIPQMVSSIQSRENFVEYEELPTIYIDAVISVERI